MGGSNAVYEPEYFPGPAAGTAPLASLKLIGESGELLPVSGGADAAYFLNPIGLADPNVVSPAPVCSWSLAGTSNLISIARDSINLTVPAGASAPSWRIEMKATYASGATDRYIGEFGLSLVNEDGNTTISDPANVLDNSLAPIGQGVNLEIECSSQFTVYAPGSTPGDAVQFFPYFSHVATGAANTDSVMLYQMTLDVYYTGDIPGFAFTAVNVCP